MFVHVLVHQMWEPRKDSPRGLAMKCNAVPTKAGARALQLTRQGQDPLDGSVFELQYDVGEINSQ